MQVREILRGANGTFQRPYVGLELDEVTGNESCRQSKVAQRLHQQPSCVAAGAAALFERLLQRLHTRVHANDVTDHLLQTLICLRPKIDGIASRTRDRSDELFHSPPSLVFAEIGNKVITYIRHELKWPLLCVRFDE